LFILQKSSNHGTATPAVARTVMQGSDLLRFIDRSDSEKDAAIAVLIELQRHLIKCVEIRDLLANEVVFARLEIENHGVKKIGINAISIPSVSDLQARAEVFLQSAKLAVAETGNLTAPFYSISFGHKYHDFISWTKAKFGDTDVFYMLVKSWEPFVKTVSIMRNAVDHPSEKNGHLITSNFSVMHYTADLVLVDPRWGIGNELRPILPDFDDIIEKIIVLGENILVRIFYKLKVSLPFEVIEIPANQRDPDNPCRLRVELISL
jgi:hypothetical protein